MNPTKLVLHFSDFSVIFYAIYKKQGNSLYYFSCTFAAGTLERTLALQSGPWVRLADAGGQNLASSPVLAAGEGRGEGLWTTGARFGWLFGPCRRPARGAPAAAAGSTAARQVLAGAGEARQGNERGRYSRTHAKNDPL
jgi:hypothetical protein